MNTSEKIGVPYPNEWGEEVVSVQQMHGSFYVFTKSRVYKMNPPERVRWYQKLWRKLSGAVPPAGKDKHGSR